MTFKEIDLNREFEISGHEVDFETNEGLLKLTCRFVYYPSSPELYEVGDQIINWVKEAHVDLIEVKDREKDLFGLLSERVIMKIEQQILEDLLK